MHTKTIFSFLFFFGITLFCHAQELIRKVPADANILITVNNKAVFKHLDIEDVNNTLAQLGFFEKAFYNLGANVSKLQDIGVDFNSKAYFFGETTDSIQYLGGLIPLSDSKLWESNISAKDEIVVINGLKTVYSSDSTLRVSWDSHTVYLLGGLPVDNFFEHEHVKELYHLPDNPYSYNYYDYNDDHDYDVLEGEVVDEWTAYDFDKEDVLTDSIDYVDWWGDDDIVGAEVDSVDVDTVDFEDEWEDLEIAMDAAVDPDSYEVWWDGNDDYALVDSVLSRDEYSDDYYTEYSTYARQRDSVINTLIHSWVNTRIEDIITGRVVGTTSKTGFERMSDNTIAGIKIQRIDAFYHAFFPVDILTAVGMGSTTGLQNLNYGIEEITAELVVDRNKLIAKSDVLLDNEMARYYKAIYNKKINRKFLRFLDEETLGFMALNVDTEAYIKYLPMIMERYYGPLAGKYSDYLSLGTLLFDVLVDEKAVSKVFKGDNLLMLNGVTKVEVNYTDYEYDEDFNYIEIERTKSETIPHFVWMFSSDDMRLFTKSLAVAVREGAASDLGGIYALEKNNQRNPITLYLLMKDGIVFLGNDLEQLESIRDNGISGKGHRPYTNMARKNSFAMLFNTKKLPEILVDLEIPLSRSIEATIAEMSQYGDFYIQSSGIKRNRMSGEMGVEVPNTKGNALAFLFGIIERWANDPYRSRY